MDNVLTAVEAALLDLLGQCLGVPVAELLGSGLQRERVPVLAYLFYIGDRGQTDLPYLEGTGGRDDWLRLRHERALTPEAIVRLLDMGMDPFNFADALLGILAQRLARRLCPSCKKPHVATEAELKALLDEYALELVATETWKRNQDLARQTLYKDWIREFGNERGDVTLYTAVGCEACNGTGYKGRVGLHELLVGTDAIKKNIQEHARVAEMFATAVEEGMRTLKQDGIEKVLLGVTDIHQVRSVCIK